MEQFVGESYFSLHRPFLLSFLHRGKMQFHMFLTKPLSLPSPPPDPCPSSSLWYRSTAEMGALPPPLPPPSSCKHTHIQPAPQWTREKGRRKKGNQVGFFFYGMVVVLVQSNSVNRNILHVTSIDMLLHQKDYYILCRINRELGLSGPAPIFRV